MGFRTYIGRMSKDSANKIKTMNRADVIRDFGDESHIDEDYPPGPYELVEEVYELGKYVDIDVESFRLFDNDELERHYNSDYIFHGLTKQGFHDILDGYRKDIATHYKSMYDSLDIVGADQEPIRQHLRGMTTEWHNDYTNAIDLSDNPRLTSSWKYEYAIFEMVRLFKLFDWENDIAVIYGY